MIPLKDEIPARRFPVLTVALIAAAAVAVIAAPDHVEPWELALGAGFVWLFGPSVEDAAGPAAFALFVAVGAGATAVVEPAAAPAGLVAAVLAGYAVLYPRAHVIALTLVPGWMTVVEVPALAVVVLWLPLQALAGGPDPAPLAGAATGLLTVRLLARRPQADYARATAA